jgi:hypothetical protein
MLKKVLLLCSMFFALQANETVLAKTNFSDKDFEKVSDSLTLNSAHRSVAGASHLGGVLIPVGIQASLYGSLSSSDIMKEKFGEDYSSLYHLGSIFMLGVPFGVDFELAYEPDLDLKLGNYNPKNLSFAVRWAITSVVPIPFVAASLRLHRSTAQLSFNANFSNDSTDNKDTKRDFKAECTAQGVDLLVSVTAAPFVEPYLGVGFVNSSTTFELTNKDSESLTIFSSGKAKDTKERNQARFLGGISVSLALFKAGLEAELLGGNSIYSFKLGLGI